MIRAAALACATLPLVACAQTGTPGERAMSEPDGPQVRVTGEPVACITRSRIRDTRVRSDQVIDFEMVGGDVYRNTLPNRCPGLNLERAFSYSTSTSQLCSVEIIYTLRYLGGELQRGAGCGIGQFVPIEYQRDD